MHEPTTSRFAFASAPDHWRGVARWVRVLVFCKVVLLVLPACARMAAAQKDGVVSEAGLDSLELSDASFDVVPGGKVQLGVGRTVCCVFFKPATARVEWSITPGDGPRIDRTSGIFRVDQSTAPGITYRISASTFASDPIPPVRVRIP